MNDESLTSDELFKSGSANGFVNNVNSALQNHQGNDIDSVVNEPRLHLLGERIQETNETHVKELNDSVESLIHDLDSLTLSTDGDDYADIHQLNGLHGQIEIDGADVREPSQNGTQQNQYVNYENTSVGNRNGTLPYFEATLKEPDLPALKLMSWNEQLRSRGSQSPHKDRTVQAEKDNRHEQALRSRLFEPESVAEYQCQSSHASRQRPEVFSVQNLPNISMADSHEPQENVVQENETGARSKVRDKDDRKAKGKKQAKGAKPRISDTHVSDMPRPPFKLQQKKYDSDFVEFNKNYNGREISSNEHRTTENLPDGEIQRFPVEYLNPYANPKALRTIKPGGRSSPKFLPSGFQTTESVSGIKPAIASVNPVVRPKTNARNSNTVGIRHINSDPQMHSTDSLAVQRGSVDISISAENLHDNDNTPVFNELLRLEEETPSSDNHSSDVHRQRTEIGTTVTPTDNSGFDMAAKVSNKAKDTTNLREKRVSNKAKDSTKAKDSINMNIWRSQQEAENSAPPHTIGFINNLDTITTKKVQNKDMKNTNRSRTMDRNPNVSIANANSSNSEHVETVLSHSPLQYPNFDQSVIDLQTVSQHIVPDSNGNSVDRLNKSNEPKTEPHPIIVPYEHERNAVQILPSFDESLQSNVLFGDGTEVVSDEMLAKMLQEKYDKEHEEMMRRNQYDVTPETLRLHNLTTDLNVADGGFHDPYTSFNDDLETDSLLIHQNMNDVYEASPRSVNSDQGPQESVNIVHNTLDQESDRLYPHSITEDSIALAETEQYCPVDQLYPEMTLFGRESDETNENQHEELSKGGNDPNEIHVPYSTENHRDVLPPELLDNGTIYIRAEQEEAGAERSDESFARSLQRQLLLEEQEQWDEELARQLEEEEQEERETSYRPGFRNRQRRSSSDSQHPLHSRFSVWNSRPLHVGQLDYEPPQYRGTRQIQNTWDRPLRQANVYSRPRLTRQNLEGYDIYGNEYEPDMMPDQYGEDDFVSISRDPRLLATVLMGRAPNMMVPDNVDLNDYEALWDLAEELGEVRRVGMDQQAISLLPVHTYQAPEAAEGGDKEGGDCRVCLVDFASGDRLRTLPCCHIYHVDCIDQWLKRNAVCPVCRQSARQ